ncbi:trypsin-like peptidase domain-containing protein [Candidatus Poribacteria bacterium]
MRTKQITSMVLAVILALVVYCEQLPASDSILRSMEKEFIRIVDDVSPAIVEIIATRRDSIGQQQSDHLFFPQLQRMTPYRVSENVGTGIIFDKRGYIITTESVVGGADKVLVTLADGRILKAEIMGIDSPTDVALIRIDAKNLPTVHFGNSDNVQAGSWIVTIGRSYGSSPTLSFGVVSGLETLPGTPGFYDAIKINASVSPGNSGGGVIDMDGRLVGIITAALAEPRAIDFGSLVPGNDLKATLRQAKSREKLARSKLYAAKTELDTQQRRYESALAIRQDVSKANVDYISAQSQYEDALTNIESLMSQPEISIPHKEETRTLKREIAEMRDQLERKWESKHSLENLKEILEKKDWLGNINALIGKLQGVRIRGIVPPQRARFFGRQEESFAIPITFARQIIDDLMDDGKVERGWLGVSIQSITNADMEDLGLGTNEGVMIKEVLRGGPADEAGVQKNDVIIGVDDRKVRRKIDLVRIVAATRPLTKVNLDIIRNGQSQVINVEIGKMGRE